jgi:hypothetical protein
MEVLYGMCLYE